MIKKYFLLFSLLVGLATSFFGCQSKWTEKKGKKPVVVVSVAPYISLVKWIGGDFFEVHSAVNPGFDPHLNEITPRQAKKIEECDLWIGIGEAYEERLVSSLKQAKKDVQVLQLNEIIDLLPPTAAIRSHQDLHFWMSPLCLIEQAQAISAALSALIPERAALHEQNLADYTREIRAFDGKISEQLKSYKGKGILVSHPFLGYFCRDYNLSQISLECQGKSPTAQRAQSVLSLAEQCDVHCAFTSLQHPTKGALLVAKRLMIPTHAIDPLGEDPLDTIQKVVNAITSRP